VTWFKVDDTLAFHEKAVRAGNSAMGLWVRAGSWSAQQLTDGFIPDDMVRMLGSHAQARRLVKENLWEPVDGGFIFHQWSAHGRNPTRSEVLERRRKEAEKKAKARAAKSGKAQDSEPSPQGTDPGLPEGAPEGVTGGVRSTRPDPSRPVPASPNGDTPPVVPRQGTSSRGRTSSTPDRFDEFWSAYPRRVGKQAAIKAWRKAVELTDPDTIIEGARRYAAARDGEDPKYTAHPSTWLNAGRWDDEPEPRYTPPPKMSTKDERIARLQALKTHIGEAPDDEPPHGLRALPGGVA